MWYTSAYVCMPATLCALIPVRVYLARFQYSVRLVPFTIGRVAAGVFGQSVCVYVCCDPSLLYLSFGSGSSCTSPRIICLFRSPHTSNPFEPFPACVSLFFSAGSYRRGCRCNPVPLPYRISLEKYEEKRGESTAFCCFLHVRELIYDSAFARKARCMCASVVTRKREEARETVSTVPFISPVSRSYISGDSGISSRREIAMKNRVYLDAS